MAELKCGFCKKGKEVEEVCGKLHHIANTTFEKPCTAHLKCMQYSALLIQYKVDHFGGFKIHKVFDELTRGRTSKCSICKAKKAKVKGGNVILTGATCGCAVKSCRKTYHYYCAKTSNDCVTKRLVVSFKNKGKKTVLYRVFCSKDHETFYRQHLKEYSKDVDNKDSDGDDDNDADSDGDGDDDDADGDEDDDQCKTEPYSDHPDSHNTSFITPSSPECTPLIKENSKNGHMTKINLKRKSSPVQTDNNCFKKERISDIIKHEVDNNDNLVDEGKRSCIAETTSIPNESNQPPQNGDSTIKQYAVCILSTLDDIDKQREEIFETIESCYEEVEHTVIWQDISSNILTQELTPYFIHAISKAVKSKSMKNLQSLLFSEKYLKEKCQSDFQCHSNFIKDLEDPALDKNVTQRTWKTISQNLKDASTLMGKLVGTLIPINDSDVLVLFIGDELDQNNVIRTKLRKSLKMAKKTVHVWKSETKLKVVSDGSFCQAEVDILCSYLENKKAKISKVIVHPTDQILLQLHSSPTVVSHLVEKFKHFRKYTTETKNSICLILLSELDKQIVDFNKYMIKMLDHILEQHKSKLSRFLVLLPVTTLPKLYKFEEEIKRLIETRIDISIMSAFNPEEEGISCILIDLMVVPNISNGINTKPTVVAVGSFVQDGEKPSTSGTSKKRRLKANLSPSALSLQQSQQ